jgi:hypothetical protein
MIDRTVPEACRASEQIASYRQVAYRHSVACATQGFALLASFDHPHFTLVLPDISELAVARLGSCFDDPIPNPGAPSPG